MNDFEGKFGFTEQEWNVCLKVLKTLKENPFENPDNQTFGALITKLHKSAKKGKKQQVSTEKKREALKAVNNSTIAVNALSGFSFYGEESDDMQTHFTEIQQPRNCYACNTPYHQIHSFYHRLCPECALKNFDYRSKKVDLSGRKVVLTGGRVKVGYATALKFLRNHAELTITTRFPAIAYAQFQKEHDFETWKDRLTVYGLDLRNLEALGQFIDFYFEKNNTLDILVNNAAQTIQYDNNYYTSLLDSERKLLQNALPITPNKTNWIVNSQIEDKVIKQVVDLNRFGQPVDERLKTSWNSTLEEIDMRELLEVNLINHISPYILIKELTPLMKKSSFDSKFIINVTSSEGQFSYSNKTIFHPHTNMTKAALNMLTRTSGKAYARHNIFMNCVDVGWISTGATEHLRKKQFKEGYIPPLDSVDGAARILHPIYEKIENNITFIGTLIKNYKEENW